MSSNLRQAIPPVRPTILENMMRSMTAYARVEQQFDWGKISWELRSVNQRYLEIYLKLADNFKFLEMPAREIIKQAIARGKLEGFCFIETTQKTSTFQVNQDLMQQLAEAVETVQSRLPESTHLNPLEFLRWPNMMQTAQTELPPELLTDAMNETLQQALAQLNENREREGNALVIFLADKVAKMREQIELVKTHFPTLLAQQTQALQQRIETLVTQVEEARFHQEVAILAQKADITEEIERLETHLTEVSRLLTEKGVVGRRLDFLMQELNREANTLGSKSFNSQLSQASVECKVLIEQMREQIQNIE